jgi:sugar lactone lactonase YvrE
MTSRLREFAKGDVFASATILNNPIDDRAGLGRIIQYDSRLKQKAVFTTDLTTHLITGLKFDRAGRLWAFDSRAFVVLVIDRKGRVERRHFAERPFSNVNFLSDGSVLLAEHLVGSHTKERPAPRYRPMSGTDRFGDGHVFKYTADGLPLKEYATQTRGGSLGCMGVTASALSPDGSTLYYVSETDPRLMRYDLKNDRQLADLASYAEGSRETFFGLALNRAGDLLVCRGARIDVMNPQDGRVKRSYVLEEGDWTTVAPSADGRFIYAGNIITGELARLDTTNGTKVSSVNVGTKNSLAGLAEYDV